MSTSVSSTNSTSSSAATTDASGLARYFGLASGLDVDSIVKGLMTQDQNKLDKANQQKQILEWKQDAYQSITKAIRTFESTYLSFAGGSSMLSSNAYCSFTGTSNSTSLTVSGNSGATPGRHYVKIYQSAIAGSVTGTKISPSITGTVDSRTVDLSGTSFNITVDGVQKTICFNAGETAANLDQKLQDAYGLEPDGKCKVAATVDGNGIVSINSNGDYNSTITVSSTKNSYSLIKLGISDGASNRVDTSADGPSLKDIFGSKISTLPDGSGNFYVQINGNAIELNNNDSLMQTFSKINAANAGVSVSYNQVNDTVQFLSTVGGKAGNVTLDDEGATGFFNAILGTDAQRTTVNGRDSIISVDGTKVSRSSNDFTVSGINYSIKNTINYTDSPNEIQIDLTSNTDAAVKNIKGFVDAYNKLITDISNQVYQQPANITNGGTVYKPLTAAQQDKMTQDQIDKWNTEAKKGVIFNDSTVVNIVQKLGDAIESTVTTTSGKILRLNDIGITKGTVIEGGQLHVDDAKLQAALQNSPNDVLELFSKTS